MFNVRSPLDLKCSKFSAIFIFLICDWWCLICQREGSTRLYDRQDQYGFSIVIIVFTRVILVNRMSSKAKYIAAVCVLFSTCGSNWQKHRFSESFDLYFPLCVYHVCCSESSFVLTHTMICLSPTASGMTGIDQCRCNSSRDHPDSMTPAQTPVAERT